MSHRNKEKYEINQTNYTYRYYYNINDILCIKQDCTIKPVSYTHLDVYKRQPVERSSENEVDLLLFHL